MPQNVLAQIWGLSDVDADGKLSTEEFILAGHLCDLALKGEPLPAVGHLPPALVPPSLRKGAAGKLALFVALFCFEKTRSDFKGLQMYSM